MGRVERTRVSQVTPEKPGIPYAVVLTASFVLSPATGLSCHRRLANTFARLDASVGASGPHDFSVRFRTVRYRRVHVHRIPPRVRDDREPPLMWDGTAIDIDRFAISENQNIFARRSGQADRQRIERVTDLPVGSSVVPFEAGTATPSSSALAAEVASPILMSALALPTDFGGSAHHDRNVPRPDVKAIAKGFLIWSDCP